MSSQPSLISVSTDAKIQRPRSASQWQFFRDTAAAGSGSYYAMNFNGVKEPIAGAASQIVVDINATAPFDFSSTVVGGTAPYTYEWSINSFNQQTLVTGLTSPNLVISGSAVASTVTLAPDEPTESSIGLLKLKVTDANGYVAKDFILVAFGAIS